MKDFCIIRGDTDRDVVISKLESELYLFNGKTWDELDVEDIDIIDEKEYILHLQYPLKKYKRQFKANVVYRIRLCIWCDSKDYKLNDKRYFDKIIEFRIVPKMVVKSVSEDDDKFIFTENVHAEIIKETEIDNSTL